MLSVENIAVYGTVAAVRGMRNPLKSWGKSDSEICKNADANFACESCPLTQDECWTLATSELCIGPNDLDLMRRLYHAGPEHRKFMRFIHVSMDIKAPDFWFREFSTYRIGVTENSTSTMHTLTKRPLTALDFSLEDMDPEEAKQIVAHNEARRLRYLETKEQGAWRALIEGLPMSYNYLRTVDFNYENAATMIKQRTGHKLKEWRDFVEILKGLPYMKQITEE